MEKIKTSLPELKLIGLTCRTNNKSEIDSSAAKIGPTLQKYFSSGYPDKIPNRQEPGVTYCIYTDYESDFTGDYTYFIGEKVTDFTNLPEGLSSLTIPVQKYIKFTTSSGEMPGVCIDAWQKIWAMSSENLDGTRSYIADFEVYDQRASDPTKTILDIYISINE